MLELQPFPIAKNRSEWLKDFDLSQATLVVSDLKTKVEIQGELLKRQEVLSDEAVLRASELWRRLALRLSPEVRIISADLARSLISDWLSSSSLAWARKPGASQRAFQFIHQLLPILAHPQGREWMQSWLGERPDSLIRWSHWYELAQQLWDRFQEERLVATPWLAGYLLSLPGLESSWKRPFVFHLGADLSGVEVELLKALGQKNSVRVLVPEANWIPEYKTSLLAYDFLAKTPGAGLGGTGKDFKDNEPLSRAHFLRFSSQLAEVRAATSQVRAWVDQGVDPQQIALVAPDIEAYWPCLREYLAQEGLPMDKAQVASHQGFLATQIWLAQLRLSAGEVSSGDLILRSFPPQDPEERKGPSLNLSFERFRQLFARIYDREDLLRDESLRSLYEESFRAPQILNRDEFLAWALRHWPSWGDADLIQQSLAGLYQECPPGLSLRLETWLRHLEKLEARREVEIQPPQAGGIQCVSLRSAEWLQVSHIWLMGMMEESVRDSEGQGVPLGDILSLSANFGLSLAHPDQAQLEFEARSLLDRGWQELCLSAAETDFMGKVMAPSLLWLRGRALNEGASVTHRDTPSSTRWEERQKQSPEVLGQSLAWSEPQKELLVLSLRQDWGLERSQAFGQGLRPRLSVSQLEKYLKCPFIFAAEKLLGLVDASEVDLDLDAASRGQLMHGLFEELLDIESGKVKNLSAEEIDQILERRRLSQKLVVGDSRLWDSLKTRYRDLGLRFIQFESQWRQNFPDTRTLSTELKLKGSWSLEKGALVAEGEGDFPFAGSVDRVDGDGKNYVLIDYKSSTHSVGQIGSWLDKDSLQMSLYAQAIEMGLGSLPPGPVAGAFYYVSKNFDRSKGFRLIEAEQSLYSPEGKDKGKVSLERRDEVFAALNQRVQQAALEIDQGQLAPQPKNEKDCRECHWRFLCRAPHLN